MNTGESIGEPQQPRQSPEPQPKRILLVDDDRNVAETLAELLELEGYRVTVRYDAPAALEQARRDPPDLVLCDLSLAGAIDGLGFARACRADPALRGLRLLAVSGYDRPEDHRRARASGFDALVGKPIDLKPIHAALGLERDDRRRDRRRSESRDQTNT